MKSRILLLCLFALLALGLAACGAAREPVGGDSLAQTPPPEETAADAPETTATAENDDPHLVRLPENWADQAPGIETGLDQVFMWAKYPAAGEPIAYVQGEPLYADHLQNLLATSLEYDSMEAWEEGARSVIIMEVLYRSAMDRGFGLSDAELEDQVAQYRADVEADPNGEKSIKAYCVMQNIEEAEYWQMVRDSYAKSGPIQKQKEALEAELNQRFNDPEDPVGPTDLTFDQYYAFFELQLLQEYNVSLVL